MGILSEAKDPALSKRRGTGRFFTSFRITEEVQSDRGDPE
jgi:hypothetical protein